MSRSYVPAVVSDVARWYDEGAIPAGRELSAVTPELIADHQHADDEELEYLASVAALERATAMAADSEDRPAVIAVEAEATGEQTAAEVPVSDWAAVFVDDMLWYAVEEVPFL